MIGERIRICREREGISQEELAHRIGKHANTVARWERDELVPRCTSVAKLAEVLNTTSDYLLGKTDAMGAANPQKETPLKANLSPKTKSNEWMLVYERDGERMELPPTEQGYAIMNVIANAIVNRQIAPAPSVALASV